MRIAVISTPIFKIGVPGDNLGVIPLSGYAGLEVVAYHCAKGLANLGHQVALIAPDGSECPGVQVIGCGPAGRIDEAQSYSGIKGTPYNGFWNHLLNFDCIIDHTWTKQAALLKMEGRLKCPILAVCHAPINTMYKELPPKGVMDFVCISEDQGNHFRALYSRDCRVCLNGVDLDYYKPLNIPRTNRFLFLARFSTIKGPQLCIEACKNAEAELDMIGDVTITHEPELIAFCKAQADGKKIKIVGNQPRGSCVYHFSKGHALIHAARDFREPFGLAPVEAMACGSPVICFDNGALRETVIHKKTGWIAKDMKAFVEHIKEAKDGISEEMRKNCREQASKFSVKKMSIRYAQLCEEAVGGTWDQ